MNSIVQTEFVAQHADLATAIGLLDKWVTLKLRDLRVPGLAVGLVHAGQLIWGKGYGLADIERAIPVKLDTRFRIASITKTFTGVAILQLRDAGKLRLDDPVSTYLGWFKLGYAGAPSITIRHLLTHTSGLPRDATIPHWTDNQFQTWDEVIATTQQRKALLPPDQEFGYSNLGYSLLGGVIEAVSGQSWADYIQTHILKPLEMNTTIVAPVGDEPDFATGYLVLDDHGVRKPAPFVATNGFSASASMASSVNDLVKYARFHLSKADTPVLSGHSLRAMHNIHWLNPDWQGGYGLGVAVQRIDNWTVSGHAGGYKGYLTQFLVCREHNFGVIVLTNSVDSDPFNFVEQAYKLALPEVIKVVTPKAPEPKPEWRRFVGTYYGEWGETEVVIRGGQLQLVSARWLNLPPTTMEPTENPSMFTLKEPGGSPETARFELDAGGQVVRLWLRSEYVLPKR